ncbi:hypothetical protein MKX03_031450, partial [Papaver bracteatum]
VNLTQIDLPRLKKVHTLISNPLFQPNEPQSSTFVQSDTIEDGEIDGHDDGQDLTPIELNLGANK